MVVYLLGICWFRNKRPPIVQFINVVNLKLDVITDTFGVIHVVHNIVLDILHT